MTIFISQVKKTHTVHKSIFEEISTVISKKRTRRIGEKSYCQFDFTGTILPLC